MSRQSFLRAHHKRVDGVTRKINRAYGELTNLLIEVAKTGQLSWLIDPDKPFTFDRWPVLKERADQICRQAADYLTSTIKQGIADEWEASEQCSDELCDEVLKTLNVPREQAEKYYRRNMEALLTFQNRKIGGMNLSQRVWNLIQQHKTELEFAIDIAIGEGTSASTLATETKKFLKEPNRLYRRVRDKHTGKLVLSKAAKAYNPGPGIYRSSYRNAFRMSRTEQNLAFREADYHRWQELDFISGFEIKRSNRVTECDLCESLKGVYPKTFKWRGWHPQCLCHSVTILLNREDMNRLEGLLLDGKSTKGFTGSNHVDTIPQGFADWVTKNRESIAKAKNTPYWVIDARQSGYLKGLKPNFSPGI